MGSSPRGGCKQYLPIKNSFHMKKQKKRARHNFHTSRSNAALLPDVKAAHVAHWPRACGLAARCWHRRLSFAARIKWVCRCSMGVAYNWSSAQRADRPPDRQQHTSDVGRCKSSHGSTCPVSPRHIPSQTHSPQPAARISAGFFAQPAAGVAGVAAGRLLWLASSRCTSSRWCCFSPAWNGSRHGLCTASERLSHSHTARLNSGLAPSLPL